MSALTLANPFADFADARPVPDLPLPASFRADMAGWDEPVHGDLVHPSRLLPGDYLLDAESGTVPAAWVRVAEVAPVADGTRLVTSGGLAVTVPPRRHVWVFRAPDVLAWAVLSESAGAR